jgi:nicotinamidase-related amidase
MKTALLLIDIQNDYFPGGKMVLEGSLEAGQKANRLLEYFRKEKFPRIFVQHVSTRSGATFFLPDTDGVNIHESVRPAKLETVIQKHYPNAFRDTRLLSFLRESRVQALVIGGMMTHLCVDATVRAASEHGFECWIAGDACATRALTFQGKTIPAEAVQGAFLAALDGTYGKVGTVEEIIFKGVD